MYKLNEKFPINNLSYNISLSPHWISTITNSINCKLFSQFFPERFYNMRLMKKFIGVLILFPNWNVHVCSLGRAMLIWTNIKLSFCQYSCMQLLKCHYTNKPWFLKSSTNKLQAWPKQGQIRQSWKNVDSIQLMIVRTLGIYFSTIGLIQSPVNCMEHLSADFKKLCNRLTRMHSFIISYLRLDTFYITFLKKNCKSTVTIYSNAELISLSISADGIPNRREGKQNLSVTNSILCLWTYWNRDSHI